MKHLILLVDNFEDTEFISTLDVLKRGKEEVVVASLMKRHEVVSKCQNKIIVDNLIEDLDYKKFDSLIIPGGPGSFQIMPKLEIVNELIKYFADNKKLVASICAAPHLVGKLGYFKDLNYTVHPGFEDQVIGGNYLKDLGVVRDKNFITAKSMYYSIEFGLEIINYYYGEDIKESLRRACMGNK